MTGSYINKKGTAGRADGEDGARGEKKKNARRDDADVCARARNNIISSTAGAQIGFRENGAIKLSLRANITG